MTPDNPLFQDQPRRAKASKSAKFPVSAGVTELAETKPVAVNPPAENLFASAASRPQTPRARKRKPAPATTTHPTDTTPAPVWLTTADLRAPAAAVTNTPEASPIAAIETRYAGCRFRSRLEARYAVWFDHLNIEWQYEPESYLVGPESRRRVYLPDFYLPAAGTWVEVKGSENALDYQLMVDAAHPAYGLPHNLDGAAVSWPLHQVRVAFLGAVPATPGLHTALSLITGTVVAKQLVTPFCDLTTIGHPDEQAKPHGHHLAPMYYPVEQHPDRADKPDGLLTAFGYGSTCSQVVGAYTAARSARFEHGESGADSTSSKGGVSEDSEPSPLRNMLASAERVHDLKTADGRVEALRKISPVIAAITDVHRRSEWIAAVADRLGLEVDPVTRSVDYHHQHR